MLGSDLVVAAQESGLEVQVYDVPEFDITDEPQTQDVISKSEVVVNCAAYTNVEKAESEVDLANQVNGYAVGRLGLLAKEANVPVLHISTDFVFNGMKESPYIETDVPQPISAYGGSKLLGEKLLAESGCQWCIVRVQWTYGKNGTNFVTKILNAAKTRDELNVVDDQVGSPTRTVEVARVLCDILKFDVFPTGIYHCAASGSTSRYDMVRFMFDYLGNGTKVHRCKTADFKTAAQRPLNSRFDCHKLERLIGRTLPSWQEMLKLYLETL